MAGNQVTLTFGGDADALTKAAKQATSALDDVDKATQDTSKSMEEGSKSSTGLVGKLGNLGNAVNGGVQAFNAIGDAIGSANQLMNIGAERASRQRRALIDVEQASNDAKQAVLDLAQANRDLNQSELDASQAQADQAQAGIDLQQAQLDAAQAQAAYNTAVKQHGANSAEARQASIDLAQANQDVTQAQQDAKQATEDYNQALQDGQQAQQDAAQAGTDAKSAQLDLNDAYKEAHPPELGQFMQDIQDVTPLLSGLTAVIGIVTAVQWLWNTSLLANPITWIVIGIIALVAVIVLIATKTTWFQTIWEGAWKGIKIAASAVWDWLKQIPGWIETAFKKVADFITAPYKAAFNTIADAWNNTVGKLHWTVPSWIPGIGGKEVSVPHIPKFHQGGTVPGVPGQEVLAILQAGETVTPTGGGGGGGLGVSFSGDVDSAFATAFMRLVREGLITVQVA